MEALEDSNRLSMSDSISLYERYMRSFNVVDTFLDDNELNRIPEQVPSRVSGSGSFHSGNVDLSARHDDLVVTGHTRDADTAFGIASVVQIQGNTLKKSDLEPELYNKPLSPCTLNDGGFLSENCYVTDESSCAEKSDPTDVPISSEDSKSDRSKHPKPVIITSLTTMENSNNAVDSVPMFCDVRSSETVFKLPNSELSFNGTLKHVQRMKPIVDPLAVLTNANNELKEAEKCEESCLFVSEVNELSAQSASSEIIKVDTEEDGSSSCTIRVDDTSESTGDSQYQELKPTKFTQELEEKSSNKWTQDVSTSSLEASFDSGVRSPDMFSENDDDDKEEDVKDFWSFIKDFEAFDKKKVRKMEETLQGVLPPPSVTILKIDVNEMLKKYYCFLPAFSDNAQDCQVPKTPATPTKGLSFIKVPTDTLLPQVSEDIQTAENIGNKIDETKTSTQDKILTKESESEQNTSTEKMIDLPFCTEIEAKETAWPDLLKCRHFGIHYNITKFSERVETLAQRCGQRYVGAETDSTVTVYSGGLQSPSSANKRKAMRLKMAQAKSPGRRLSHLARRRQAFCSAATIGEKAHSSTAKMVLIDKNYFPHRKLINTSERKSPRVRRTPGKRTPGRKTPGKKTPAKTPKTRSGGSTKKKAMRRLLMDPESLTRSAQPTRETSKRALFISPENRKLPPAPSTSVPINAMKSKRALFGSPVRAETQSLDGTQSDHFLKRKRDMFDDSVDDSRSKMAKSLSFGGDSIAGGSQPLARRASEMFATKNMAELDEHHRKKLLWAVSEALRVHGWRMQSPGFREKASSLARLTRRLMTLPPHAARLAAPNLSTSETFLKIARQYVFAIIKGRTVDECFQEEKARLAADGAHKVSGYISAAAYQQLRTKQPASTSQIKENTCEGMKQDQPRSSSKNVLQDKMINVDSSSNSSSGLSMMEKTGLYKSNSMPSFEEAAKMRARRQISFDNVDFPKR